MRQGPMRSMMVRMTGSDFFKCRMALRILFLAPYALPGKTRIILLSQKCKRKLANETRLSRPNGTESIRRCGLRDKDEIHVECLRRAAVDEVCSRLRRNRIHPARHS